jgi:hypothetical protein
MPKLRGKLESPMGLPSEKDRQESPQIELEAIPEPPTENLPHAYTPPPPPPVPETPPPPPHIVQGRTFWVNLFRLMMPFRSWSELAGFAFICLMAFLWPWLGLLCCAGMVLQYAVLGYLFSFLFNLIYAAAEGDDRFPEPDSFWDAFREFWSEIVDPFWRFSASFLYAYLPVITAAIIYTSVIHRDEIPETGAIHIVLWALIGLGTFIWPMVMLVIACEDYGGLLRPDWIFLSIFRILPAYMMGFLVLGGIAVGGYFGMREIGFDTDTINLYNSLLYVGVMILAIYAMRIIGLLYRHYANRLPWEMK